MVHRGNHCRMQNLFVFNGIGIAIAFRAKQILGRRTIEANVLHLIGNTL
jgi:hypothetical protein